MHGWHQHTGFDAPRVRNEFMKALACQWYGTGSKCVSAGKMRQVGPESAGRNCATHGVATDAGGVLKDRAPICDRRIFEGRLLLVRRCDTGDWELPGGHVDPGESAAGAAVRETAEESGITVEITGLAGIYTDPGHVIADPRAGPGAPAVRGVLPCPPVERQPGR